MWVVSQKWVQQESELWKLVIKIDHMLKSESESGNLIDRLPGRGWCQYVKGLILSDLILVWSHLGPELFWEWCQIHYFILWIYLQIYLFWILFIERNSDVHKKNK